MLTVNARKTRPYRSPDVAQNPSPRPWHNAGLEAVILHRPRAAGRDRAIERHAESGVTGRRRECRTVPRRSVRDRSRQWTLTVGPLGDRARGQRCWFLVVAIAHERRGEWSRRRRQGNRPGSYERARRAVADCRLWVPSRSSGLGPRACSPRTCWLGPRSTARYSNALTKAPCGPGPERACRGPHRSPSRRPRPGRRDAQGGKDPRQL